ncbi:MAG TPA: hypothetical protein VK473_03885 [Terriglobales bacterium]|nr:hypothetical protein [Terriglobales bacterium]
MTQTAWVERVQELQRELEQVEKEVPTAGIPNVILDDFRRALDHLRNTIWAVTTVREKNAEQVTLAVVNSRIQRTAEMCERIMADIEASRIAMDSPNVVKLYTVLNLMHGRVRQLFS